jgi:hypothetical protein
MGPPDARMGPPVIFRARMVPPDSSPPAGTAGKPKTEAQNSATPQFGAMPVGAPPHPARHKQLARIGATRLPELVPPVSSRQFCG